MNEGKQKALEAAGYVFGDAEDFLGMTDEERAEVGSLVEAFHAAHAASDCPLCREYPTPNAETVRAILDADRGIGLVRHEDAGAMLAEILGEDPNREEDPS